MNRGNRNKILQMLLMAFSAMLISCSSGVEEHYLRDIYFDFHKYKMAVGDTMELTICYYPEKTNCGIPDVDAVWTVNNESLARVEKTGDLTARLIAEDIGIISVTAAIGGFKTTTKITIDSNNILPDVRFMDFCLSHYDANEDGILQGTEVCDIVGIDVTELGDRDLPVSFEGIEIFKRLQTFKGRHIIYENLDLSKNIYLREIDISLSQIEKLDLRNHSELVWLDCHGCENLKIIDFGNGEVNHMNWLNCSRCDIRTIDLSRCGRLNYIDCSSNRIEKLDLSGNLLLRQITCNGNASPMTIVVGEDFDWDYIETFSADEGYAMVTKTSEQ